MNATLTIIWIYLLRILPGLALGIALLMFARPSRTARVGIYLLLFVLVRDALTPLGLWALGTEAFFWIRLYDDPLFLILFGLMSGLLTIGLYYLDTENRAFFRWRRGSLAAGIPVGMFGAALIALPLFALYRLVPISERGGSVPSGLLLPILIFALLGNLLEEGLFRGYVLGHLEQKFSPYAAGVLSGLVFAFCHTFLATTVTGIGIPLLVFTLWEGVLAGLIGSRFGVIPAAIAHGGAIFLLSSGLV